MRRAFLSAMVASLLVVGLFSFARAREGAVNAAPAWSSRILLITDLVSLQKAIQEPAKAVSAVESKLNEMGRDGWELSENINGMIVLKRTKP